MDELYINFIKLLVMKKWCKSVKHYQCVHQQKKILPP